MIPVDRPRTLNDIFKLLNRNLRDAVNPPNTQVYVIDILTSSSETPTISDTEAITPATNNNVWGTAQWNLTQWG